MPSMELFVPFMALFGKDPVCILDFASELDLVSRRGDRAISCRACGSAMFWKWGRQVSPHFSHYGTPGCSKGGGESRDHILLKAYLYKALKESYSSLGFEISVELEAHLPEAGRVADVLVTFPGAARHAHEIQLSAISILEIQKRTEAYYAHGINISWYFGPGAANQGVVSYCESSNTEFFSAFIEAPNDLLHSAF